MIPLAVVLLQKKDMIKIVLYPQTVGLKRRLSVLFDGVTLSVEKKIDTVGGAN